MKLIYFANPSWFACWPSGFFVLNIVYIYTIQAYVPLKSYLKFLGVPHRMRNPVQEGARELNQAWGIRLGLGQVPQHTFMAVGEPDKAWGWGWAWGR